MTQCMESLTELALSMPKDLCRMRQEKRMVAFGGLRNLLETQLSHLLGVSACSSIILSF